jgi:1,4-alpha-glucan branching enzyme
LSAAEIAALISARHPAPRSVLGYHEYPRGDAADPPLCIVRVLEPDATSVELYWEDAPETRVALRQLDAAGLFEGRVPYRRPLPPYRLRVRYRNGAALEKHDAYYFAPQLSDYDLYLFGEGNHFSIHHKLARTRASSTASPARASPCGRPMPNASASSAVQPVGRPQARNAGARKLGHLGAVHPGVGPGTLYKYEIRTKSGATLLKADPYGFAMELRPGNCSIVTSLDGYEWHDEAWLTSRRKAHHAHNPINIYEVHPGSWRRDYARKPQFLNWRELADELIPYVTAQGFTHVELMAVAEHPLDRSWDTRWLATSHRARGSARRTT